MGKILLEVCMISARGLPRSSSLWKRQWFAVGWIDPNNKFCSKIDSSGSSNPTWKTKFSVTIDSMKTDLQQLSLTVEVYSRDPIFLLEKLQGTATVMLKEFFTKFEKYTEPSSRSGNEEAGSYQLRKQKSGKPQGFVDISVRISEQSESGASYPGIKEGISLAIEDGPVLAYPDKPPPYPDNHFNSSYSDGNYPYSHPQPPPSNYGNPQASNAGYHQPPPPPPLPPANTGFLPTLFPGARPLPESYVGMPTSCPAGRSSGAGFGMGLGAGALAAGAVIFGDDFMSGSGYPPSFDGSSLTVSTDSLF